MKINKIKGTITGGKVPSALSEFDEYIIKLLYNPVFKPGMDYVEAQKLLLGIE